MSATAVRTRRIEYVSPAFETATGHTRTEVLGRIRASALRVETGDTWCS
jgi:PAS domain-containing protein